MRLRTAAVHSMAVGVTSARCSPHTDAASRSVKPPPKSRARTFSRSLEYIAAPSVATVTIGVVGTEAEQLGGRDRGEHVADRREPEVAQRAQHPAGDSRRSARYAEPIVAGEHHLEVVGGSVADRDDDVGVHHVVDQRDVLVADALDVVLAEAVGEHRRALQRLDGHDPGAVVVLQPVAGGDRPGRAGRRHEGGEAQPGTVGGDVSKTWPRAWPVTS